MGLSKVFQVQAVAQSSLRQILAERRRSDRKSARAIRKILAETRRRDDRGDRELLLSVTIRLEQWTVESARRVAWWRGDLYQRVLREWIEEAIHAFVRRNR